jgi:uncharacterized protein (DUF1778 family)
MVEKFKHGGARPGAGRPKIQQERKAVNVRVSLEAYHYIQRAAKARAVSLSQAVEDAILACYKK